MLILTIGACLIIIIAAAAGLLILKKEYFPLLAEMLCAEKLYELSQEETEEEE